MSTLKKFNIYDAVNVNESLVNIMVDAFNLDVLYSPNSFHKSMSTLKNASLITSTRN